MPTLKKRISFYESEEGARIKTALEQMAGDARFNTDSTYTANEVTHPDNLITFVERHMSYLNNHPSLDADQYLANIRLKTRLR